MQIFAIIVLVLYVLSFLFVVAINGFDNLDWRKVITHFVAGFCVAVLIYE